MKVKNKAKSLDNNWNKEINKTQTANSKSEKKKTTKVIKNYSSISKIKKRAKRFHFSHLLKKHKNDIKMSKKNLSMSKNSSQRQKLLNNIN